MPVEYSGLAEEHLAVRTRAGLFDVTHMGQIEIAGTDALAAVQWVTCNDASRLKLGPGPATRRLMTPAGTFVDDLLVYRLGDEPLPAGRQRRERREGRRLDRRADRPRSTCAALDTSARYALVALQGPLARQVLQPLAQFRPRRRSSTTGSPTARWPASAPRSRARGTPARTGTRCSCRPRRPARVWDAILDEGQRRGRGPGRARRARHAAARSGHAPLRPRHRRHARRCSRPTSSGSSAGTRATSSGAPRWSGRRPAASTGRLVGFEMVEDRAIARHGYPVVVDGAAGRARDQRHPDAVPEEGHRHGLPAGRARGAGHRVRHRHPRPPARAHASFPCHSTSDREADMYPADFKYTKDHEWIRVTGDTGRVGITDYAQKQLGDVVYLELPQVGPHAHAGRELRHGRVGQGRLRALQPGRRRRRRRQHGPGREARGRQRRPARATG